MRLVRSILSLLVLATAFVPLHCTSPSGPVADGGTHTGNPDMTACVEALYEAMETGDEWRVDYYVTPEQLDPSSIDPHTTTRELSKRGAGGASIASGAALDTIVIVDTLVLSDTHVEKSMEISRDTTYDTTAMIDTVDTLLGDIPVTYMISSLMFDTVVRIDTLVWYDTLLRIDTMHFHRSYFVGDGPTSSTPESTTTPSTGSEWEVADSGTWDKGGGELYQNASPVTRLDGSMVKASAVYVSSLARNYRAADGAVVVQRYDDADGNGTLYEADAGEIPAALLTERRIDGAGSTELWCRFDAGGDGRFASTADNPIDSLLRLRYRGEMLEERVVFHGLRSSSNAVADRAILSRFVPTDSVLYRKTVYVASGERLTRLDETRIYTGRVGYIDSLFFHLDGFSKGRGEALSAVSFEAVLRLRTGGDGRFTGTIDQNDGLVGRYRVGEALYRVTARGPKSVTIEKIDNQ